MQVIGEIETLQRLPTTFTILAASCVLSVAFVLFLVPETCGKTPDLIQKELATTGFNVLGTNAARKYVALETPPTTETESNNTDPKNSSYPPISPPKLFWMFSYVNSKELSLRKTLWNLLSRNWSHTELCSASILTLIFRTEAPSRYFVHGIVFKYPVKNNKTHVNVY